MGLLTLTMLGGVLALDETSVGQFMVSRPLVAGTVAGFLLGSPGTGLTLGAILELFYLAHFHVGGARFPESAPAAIVAVASATATPGAGGLALGLICGLAMGELGGRTVTALRHLNMKIVPDPSVAIVHEGEVWRAHLAALSLDFLRGASVTLVGILVLPTAVGWLAPTWPLAREATMGLLLAAATVPLGILWRGLSGSRNRKAVFAVGLVAGIGAGMLF